MPLSRRRDSLPKCGGCQTTGTGFLAESFDFPAEDALPAEADLPEGGLAADAFFCGGFCAVGFGI
jgi:hypothetical protein